MKDLRAACAASALGGLLATAALAAPALDPGAVIAKSTQALGRTVGSHALTDSRGIPFALRPEPMAGRGPAGDALDCDAVGRLVR